MQDAYGVAAFRSRQQVLRLESALRAQGVPVRPTPAAARGSRGNPADSARSLVEPMGT